MDLQPQASFIPKSPLTTASAIRASHSILWLIALFVFGVSIVAAVAVFLYGAYLQSSITSAINSLTRAQAAYDPAAIADLVRLDDRIRQAQTLLDQHVAPSAIFSFLETNTLPSVRFTQFNYTENPDGSASIKLSGEALDFASVALQSDQFSTSTSVGILQNVIFSNLNIDPTTGLVSFNVAAEVGPGVILYKNVLASIGTAPPGTGASSGVSSAASSTTP